MKKEFLGTAAAFALLYGAVALTDKHKPNAAEDQIPTPVPTASQELKTFDTKNLLDLAQEAYLVVNPSGKDGAHAGTYMVDDKENLWSFYKGVNNHAEDSLMQIFVANKDRTDMTKYSLKKDAKGDIVVLSDYVGNDPAKDFAEVSLTKTEIAMFYVQLENAISSRLLPVPIASRVE